MKCFKASATLATALFVLVACASGGGPKKSSSSSNVLTRADIEASSMTSAYDLITSQRPQWLRPAGMTTSGLGIASGGNSSQKIVLVYMDGMRLGGVEALRTLSTNGITSIEFLSESEAATKLRDMRPELASAVIHVKTR